MIRKSTAYPTEDRVAYHGGRGVFHVETIVTREELGSSGRLFARGTLLPGDSVGMHAHTGNTEVCYILSGTGLVREEDGSETAVGPGDTNLVFSGHAHEIINSGTTPLVYLAIVLFPEGNPDAAGK